MGCCWQALSKQTQAAVGGSYETAQPSIVVAQVPARGTQADDLWHGLPTTTQSTVLVQAGQEPASADWPTHGLVSVWGPSPHPASARTAAKRVERIPPVTAPNRAACTVVAASRMR